MGLLSFLSKKSYSDLTGRDSFKSSAYDLTVASSPPIRGAYPVAGNGAKILEQFQRSYPNLASALPPRLPRQREDSAHDRGVERPKTAPSSQLSGTRSGSSSTAPSQAGSPLPGPAKKKYGPYKLPPKIVTDARARPFSPLPVNPVPSPGLASLYSSSVRSGESSGRAKGYVDLLDAHSLIRPSDFYGRVQATGTKSYGEDVAERNVQEYNRSLSGNLVLDPCSDNGADKRCLPSKSANLTNCHDKTVPLHPRVRHSVGSSLRSQYSCSHAPEMFPKRTSSRFALHAADGVPFDKPMSRAASARSERAARRQSMPSYMVRASRGVSPCSSGRRCENEKEPESFPDSLKDRARAATASASATGTRTTQDQEQQTSSTVDPTGELRPAHKRTDSEKTLPELPLSTRDRSRRRTISHSNLATGEASSRVPTTRQSVQDISSKSRGEIYDDTYHHRAKSSQDHGIPSSLPTDLDSSSTVRQLGCSSDLQGLFSDSPAQQCDHTSHVASPSTAKNHNRDGGIQGRLDHIHTISMASLSNKSAMSIRIQDLAESRSPCFSIPDRHSSLRHGSVTSETAMSTMSSNLFRPQSGHTTTTSVDCFPLSPHPHSGHQMPQALPPVPKIPFTDPFEFPARRKVPSSPTVSFTTAHRRHSSEFYLDDYASTDSDRSPSPPGGSLEKDLLFSDAGYGASGLQLPGLSEPFDMGMSISTPAVSAPLATEEPSGPSRALGQVQNLLHNEIDNLVSLLRMPAYIESDSDTDDSFEKRLKERVKARVQERKRSQKEKAESTSELSDDEMNFDIPMSRTARKTTARHTRTVADGNSFSKGRPPLDEDDDDSDP
ncbi:hypothetical protein F5Y17DRAFT_460676 [Xylariaceae sp. FL0594]|nr:hypothetical protein F5Y17DRAFT_460676 [Xylariaceae sp. FL0594]